jgi:hypothetical protein
MKKTVIGVFLLFVSSVVFASDLKVVWYGPSLFGFPSGANDMSVYFGNIPEGGTKIQLELQKPLFSFEREYGSFLASGRDTVVFSVNGGFSFFWPSQSNFRIDFFTLGSSVYLSKVGSELCGFFVSLYPIYELSYAHQYFYWQSAADLAGFSIRLKEVPLHWGGYFRYIFQYNLSNFMVFFDIGLTGGIYLP